MSLAQRLGTAVSAAIQMAERMLCFNMWIVGILRENTVVTIVGICSLPNKLLVNILASNIRNKHSHLKLLF